MVFIEHTGKDETRGVRLEARWELASAFRMVFTSNQRRKRR
jgi:hypothetical protein